MLTLTRPLSRPVENLRPRAWLRLVFGRSPAGAPRCIMSPGRDELPEAALRDLGLGREEALTEPEWSPQLPFFLQPGYGRRR